MRDNIQMSHIRIPSNLCGNSVHKKGTYNFPSYKCTMNTVFVNTCVCVCVYVHKYKTHHVRAPVISYPPWVATAVTSILSPRSVCSHWYLFDTREDQLLWLSSISAVKTFKARAVAIRQLWGTGEGSHGQGGCQRSFTVRISPWC